MLWNSNVQMWLGICLVVTYEWLNLNIFFLFCRHTLPQLKKRCGPSDVTFPLRTFVDTNLAEKRCKMKLTFLSPLIGFLKND